ncbi:MAG: pirin family protein [Pseudomonadota bacterium]
MFLNRGLWRVFHGVETSDGADVKLTRIIGSPDLNMLDPFLLLDCFESDDVKDYIGGFPAHPHRGFETATYLLNGRMRHKDNAGHEGVIEAGGVQWMTAAKGIIHSEMPEQEKGLLRGFQLWVNLPAAQKMNQPAYQEYSPATTPLEQRENGTLIKVIAGETSMGTKGPIKNNTILPIFMDLQLPPHTHWQQELPGEHNGFLYVIGGSLDVLSEGHKEREPTEMLQQKSLGVLTRGENLNILSGEEGARFLLIAGQPINEPVVRSGPFVMNTRKEILQAYQDFQNGKL